LRGTHLVDASNQVDRGAELVPRRVSDYWCTADHLTSAAFAADIEPPVEWPCRVCSAPSALQRGAALLPVRPRFSPRTSYEFLMMRRTVEDGVRILAEALAAMHVAAPTGQPESAAVPTRRPPAVRDRDPRA
jgi:hypothetical protein